MVEVQPPEFMDGQCYTFATFRQVFDSIICVEGVVNHAGGDLLVTPVGGASVNVSVAAGSAWIQGDLNGAQGIYHVTNNAAKVMTISANGAGSARTDLIIASVYDSQYIGGVDQWALEVVQGVAGGGVPAVPLSTRSGYIILGEVTVPATGGTPSTVDDGARQSMSTCGAFPYVVLRATAPTSVPDGAETQIELSTIEHTDDAFFDTSVPDQVTILQPGLYDVWAEVEVDTGGVAADVRIIVYNDATAVAGAASQSSVDGWSHQASQLSYPFVPTDFLWLWAKQESGGGTSAVGGRMLIRKVG
jgi:hypothetical protein